MVAAIVAFGVGVLVSALTFDLMEEAFETGTAAWTIGGFMLGAVIYVVIDMGLDRLAAESPKRTGRDPEDVVPGAERIPQSREQAAISGLSPNVIAAMLALAAGGIIAMLADTMMPEAFEHGGPGAALATAIGFACVFLLSRYTG